MPRALVSVGLFSSLLLAGPAPAQEVAAQRSKDFPGFSLQVQTVGCLTGVPEADQGNALAGLQQANDAQAAAMDTEAPFVARAYQHFRNGRHPFGRFVPFLDAEAAHPAPDSNPAANVEWGTMRILLSLKPATPAWAVRKIGNDFLTAQALTSGPDALRFARPVAESTATPRPRLDALGDALAYLLRHPQEREALCRPTLAYGAAASRDAGASLTTQHDYDAVNDGVVWCALSAVLDDRRYDARLISAALALPGAPALCELVELSGETQRPQLPELIHKMSPALQTVYRPWLKLGD